MSLSIAISTNTNTNYLLHNVLKYNDGSNKPKMHKLCNIHKVCACNDDYDDDDDGEWRPATEKHKKVQKPNKVAGWPRATRVNPQ